MWGEDTNEFLKTWIDLNDSSPGLLFPCCRTIERMVKKYAKMAGIEKDIVPHSFRHGKAHFILDTGGGVKDIQETLGHRNPASSFRYLNLNKAEKIKMLKKYLTRENTGYIVESYKSNTCINNDKYGQKKRNEHMEEKERAYS